MVAIVGRTVAGTTGMPKAAIISHLRMTMAAYGFKTMYAITDSDILYTVLPLYHSAGGMIGAGLMITGVTMILRDRCVDVACCIVSAYHRRMARGEGRRCGVTFLDLSV